MTELEVPCAIAHALLAQSRVEPTAVGVVEAARRRREARTLLLEYAVPLAVFDGPDHALGLVNHAWTTLLGTAPMPRDELDAVLRTGVTAQLPELRFRVGGGPEVYCRATLKAQRGTLGAIVGVIVACADITDEVVARRCGGDERSLVWGGAIDHNADYFNRRWRDYTGGAATWQRAVHVDDLARCVQAFGEAARRRVSTDIEARIARNDGECRWHRVRFTLDAAAHRWLGSASDIHDTRLAEAERTELLGRERAARADAEQANRMKDQFLAAVSHELRAPLTTMLLWEKVLRDDTVDDELHGKALEAIHQSAMAQSRLVADLLDVSRAISGKLFVDPRPIEIDGILRDAIAAAGTAAGHKRLTLDAKIASQIGEVLGDAHRLRQVLDNLLSNAVKFTDEGGRVSVTARRAAGSVVIAIEDSGRGIAADFLPRLFEPFSQTDDALTRAQGGLGLGLSIARQLVALHHGTLEATSAGLDRGATFTLTLPAMVTLDAAAPARTLERRATALDRVRVLVVDDDRRVRDALALLLGRAGALVETAESAASARVQFAHRAPDALVCDVAMPEEDGYSFVRTIRDAGGKIPAIALTAHATIADGERALASGFDLHLAKPVDLELLVASIHDLLAARRRADRP